MLGADSQHTAFSFPSWHCSVDAIVPLHQNWVTGLALDRFWLWVMLILPCIAGSGASRDEPITVGAGCTGLST